MDGRPKKALEFKNSYIPSCDMLLAKIRWDGLGKLLLFWQQQLFIIYIPPIYYCLYQTMKNFDKVLKKKKL